MRYSLLGFLALSLGVPSAGQTLVKDIYRPDAPTDPSSFPADFIALEGRVLFSALTEAGRELWVSDGTEVGTEMVLDLHPTGSSDPRGFVVFQDQVFFFASNANGPALWRSNGTTLGTVLVSELPGDPEHLTVLDDLLIFYVGSSVQEIWRSDGTEAGTTTVAPSGLMKDDAEMAAFEGHVYFSHGGPRVLTGKYQLWRTDGTLAGTELVKILDPVEDGDPKQFTIAGGKLFFTGEASEPIPLNLWTTDGTEAGTIELAWVNAGPPAAVPNDLVPLDNGLLLFTVRQLNSWAELWYSDGTPEGTAQFYEAPLGGMGGFISLGDEAWFQLHFGIFADQVWKTDGTEEGTQFLGPTSSFLGTDLVHVGSGDLAVWAAVDVSPTDLGFEAFLTDGVTIDVLDVNPGDQGSSPGGFTRAGGLVFFSAWDVVRGYELHAFPLADWDGWVGEPFGNGCGLADAPTLDVTGQVVAGESMQFEVRDADPSAPVLLYASAIPATLPIGGCAFYLGSLGLLATGGTTATGAWDLAVTAPSIPALFGVPIYLQAVPATPGGPVGGLAELTNALEIVLAGN